MKHDIQYGAFLVLLLPALGSAEVPNTFAAGEAAVAAEVNENFANLDGRLSAMEEGTVVTVSCPGDTISAALASLPPAGPATIEVTGACAESVLIHRSNLVVRGAGAGASVSFAGPGDQSLEDTLSVVDARRVRIENLTLTGGDLSGLHVDRTASVQISGVTLENNGRFGLLVEWGGYVQMRNSEIRGNGESAAVVTNAGRLEILENNSIVQGPNAAITANTDSYAVGSFLNSHVRISGGGNTITNTVDPAVGRDVQAMEAFHSSHIRSDGGFAEINGDILAGNFSIVSLRDSTLNGDVIVDRTGTIELRERERPGADTNVFGDAFVSAFGVLRLTDTATLNGSVSCSGGILRVSNTASVTGTIDFDC